MVYRPSPTGVYNTVGVLIHGWHAYELLFFPKAKRRVPVVSMLICARPHESTLAVPSSSNCKIEEICFFLPAGLPRGPAADRVLNGTVGFRGPKVVPKWFQNESAERYGGISWSKVVPKVVPIPIQSQQSAERYGGISWSQSGPKSGPNPNPVPREC